MSNEDDARFPYLKRMSKKKRMFKKTEKAYLAGDFLGIHFLLNSGPLRKQLRRARNSYLLEWAADRARILKRLRICCMSPHGRP